MLMCIFFYLALKLCVKSNFTNVNSVILLFSIISNYEDGQDRIIKSLKPTQIYI